VKGNNGPGRQSKRIVPSRARGKKDPSIAAWHCAGAVDCFIQQAVAGLSIGMILIDPRGRVVWLNRAAEQLLELPAAQCIGRPFTKVLMDPQLAAFWHEVMCRDGNCMADVSIRWPHQLELKLNATRCLSQDGREIGRALLFCDITSERNVKIELTKEMASRLLDLARSPNQLPVAIRSLTPQEVRTLRLLSKGLSNEDIAGAMHVATSTVRSHLKSAYGKLGLRTRAEAVSFAVRHHLG